MAVVEFALKTVRDIVNMLETMLDQQLAGLFRPVAAAADQQHRNTVVLGGLDHPAQDELAHFAFKIRIDDKVRLIDPGYVERTAGMSDKQILHIRTHVDKRGAGLFLYQGIGFGCAYMLYFTFRHISNYLIVLEKL